MLLYINGTSQHICHHIRLVPLLNYRKSLSVKIANNHHHVLETNMSSDAALHLTGQTKAASPSVQQAACVCHIAFVKMC